MKFKREINSFFGDSFTHDLRGLIEKGAIEKEAIRSLSHDMGVTTAYTANKDKDPFNGVDTMEQMLDDWYQKKLCLISQEEAWNLLVKVFEENCSPLVLHTIRESSSSGSRADQDVLAMLQSLGLVEYEEVFREQELSISNTAEMNHEDLKSIGITSVKHRKAIIKYFSGKIQNQNFKLSLYFSRQPSIQDATDWRRGKASGRIIQDNILSDSDQHGSQCRV